jgi:hypothetical protein
MEWRGKSSWLLYRLRFQDATTLGISTVSDLGFLRGGSGLRAGFWLRFTVVKRVDFRRHADHEGNTSAALGDSLAGLVSGDSEYHDLFNEETDHLSTNSGWGPPYGRQ